MIGLFNLFQGSSHRSAQAPITYSDFMSQLNQVNDVTIQDRTITGHYREGAGTFTTYAPDDPKLVETLAASGVKISAAPPEESMPSLLGILISWFPLLLLSGVWVFFMRQMQSGGGKAMGFGKARARVLT